MTLFAQRPRGARRRRQSRSTSSTRSRDDGCRIGGRRSRRATAPWSRPWVEATRTRTPCSSAASRWEGGSPRTSPRRTGSAGSRAGAARLPVAPARATGRAARRAPAGGGSPRCCSCRAAATAFGTPAELAPVAALDVADARPARRRRRRPLVQGHARGARDAGAAPAAQIEVHDEILRTIVSWIAASRAKTGKESARALAEHVVPFVSGVERERRRSPRRPRRAWRGRRPTASAGYVV